MYNFVNWLQVVQLADAAEKNDIHEVKRLIESGVSVNSTNEVRSEYYVYYLWSVPM